MTVAKTGDCRSARSVEVLATFAVVQIDALAANSHGEFRVELAVKKVGHVSVPEQFELFDNEQILCLYANKNSMRFTPLSNELNWVFSIGADVGTTEEQK